MQMMFIFFVLYQNVQIPATQLRVDKELPHEAILYN
jgi:hypothetical protein